MAALLVRLDRLECLERLERLEELELLDDNEHRRLDSTKVWQHFWDRLERLNGLGCLAQLL